MAKWINKLGVAFSEFKLKTCIPNFILAFQINPCNKCGNKSTKQAILTILFILFCNTF